MLEMMNYQTNLSEHSSPARMKIWTESFKAEPETGKAAPAGRQFPATEPPQDKENKPTNQKLQNKVERTQREGQQAAVVARGIIFGTTSPGIEQSKKPPPKRPFDIR